MKRVQNIEGLELNVTSIFEPDACEEKHRSHDKEVRVHIMEPPREA
jgi:hypothetical protein